MSKLEQLTQEIHKLSNRLRRNTVIGSVKIIVMSIMASVAIWQSYILFFEGRLNKNTDHIAIITLAGAIGSGEKYGDGLKLSQAFHEATQKDGTKAIIIEANSGGGAPVQAEIFHETLALYLSTKNHKPVYFIIEEICASACMYIAAAISNNYLFAHKNSLVGSIGVKLESFGFVEAMQTIGIERRSYTAGDNKAFLDPFKPEDDQITQHINDYLLSPLFEEFKSVIVAGRGDKLSNDPRVLSGLIWSAQDAIELGLIDATVTSWRLRQQLSEQYDTNVFIPYNKTTSKITDLLKANFWADVILSISSANHNTEVRY